jgi:uncharacterized protein (DUF1778 family)
MASEADTKVSPVNDSASPEDESGDKPITGRATKDQIYLIDRAALECGLKRGPFIVEAAVEKARTVLAAKQMLQSPAA